MDCRPWPLLSPRSPRPQAIVTLGAAAGGVLGGWLVDRAGRKLSLLFCTVPFVAGFAVITAAQDVWMLLGGRLLTGLACGVASLVAPVSVFLDGVPGPRAYRYYLPNLHHALGRSQGPAR